MNRTNKEACLACGEPRSSCIRCKAVKEYQTSQRIVGLLGWQWLALFLGAALIAVFWRS